MKLEVKEKILFILKLLISIISVYSIIYVTGNVDNKYSISSPLFVVIYILIVYLYNKYFKTKTHVLFPVVVGVILGVLQVCGYNLYNLGTVDYLSPNTYIVMIGLSVLYYSLTCLIINNYPKWKKKVFTVNFSILDKYVFNKRVIIKVMVLILLAWIPILLAFYPGNYAFDAPGEFLDYFNKNYASGNPPAHAFLLGSMMNIGHVLFKSYNTGILLYSILQMIVLSFTMACVVNFLVKHNVPNIASAVVLLLFMILPTHSVMAVTTTKDVLFSCAVSLFFMRFYHFYFEDINFSNKQKIKEIIVIIFLIFMVFISRPNGIYGYAFMLLFVLIPLRKHYRSLLLINLVVFMLYFGYNKFLDKYAYIAVRDPIDTFSAIFVLPYQQIARAYPNADLRTKARLDEFVIYSEDGTSGWLYYTPRRADGVFLHSNNRYLNTNRMRFLKTYVKTGLKYPKEYVDAFLDSTIGYWYIADQLPDTTTIRPYIEFNNKDVFNITNNEVKLDSKIPSLYNYYYKIVVDGEFQKNPFLAIFMNMAIVNLIFVIVIIYMISRKKIKRVLPLSFFIGLMGTNLLGPTCILRYMYYMFIILPVILCIAFTKNDSNNKTVL